MHAYSLDTVERYTEAFAGTNLTLRSNGTWSAYIGTIPYKYMIHACMYQTRA